MQSDTTFVSIAVVFFFFLKKNPAVIIAILGQKNIALPVK